MPRPRTHPRPLTFTPLPNVHTDTRTHSPSNIHRRIPRYLGEIRENTVPLNFKLDEKVRARRTYLAARLNRLFIRAAIVLGHSFPRRGRLSSGIDGIRENSGPVVPNLLQDEKRYLDKLTSRNFSVETSKMRLPRFLLIHNSVCVSMNQFL